MAGRDSKMAKNGGVAAIPKITPEAPENDASKRMQAAMIALVQTIVEAGNLVRRP